MATVLWTSHEKSLISPYKKFDIQLSFTFYALINLAKNYFVFIILFLSCSLISIVVNLSIRVRKTLKVDFVCVENV